MVLEYSELHHLKLLTPQKNTKNTKIKNHFVELCMKLGLLLLFF